MTTSTRVNTLLVDELMNTEGKAEIINGKVMTFLPTGRKPTQATGRIHTALLSYADATGRGEAITINAGFLCNLPNRNSFSPDAAFYTGPDNPDDEMDFYPEAPVFAVEVRSKQAPPPQPSPASGRGRLRFEEDERAIHAKIADYFAAGALVVWDVDLLNEEVIAKYSAPNAITPQIFRRGEDADAQPALPDWKMPVDALFPRV